MRIGFDKADFEALAKLWNGFYPAPMAIDADLLRTNTIHCSLFDWGASIIEVGDSGPCAFIAVKKSAAGLYPGPDPDTAHLCAIAFDSPTKAVDLMAYAKRLLTNRGIYRLIFGQDMRHFFPGCPAECPILRDFLTVEGFESGPEVVDLEADLGALPDGSRFLNVLGDYPGAEGTQLDRPVVRRLNPEDVNPLMTFLGREFPGRWRFDVAAKLEAEADPGFLFGLFVEGRLEGFALTQTAEAKLPIGGMVWRRALGEGGCTLGPIGVAARLRGQGLGDALLAGSLEGLRAAGGRRCIIDWTHLAGFYERHGFRIARPYTSYTLSLAE